LEINIGKNKNIAVTILGFIERVGKSGNAIAIGAVPLIVGLI